ncbi:MAG: diacylglycerol kinase family protein [Anaerolineae bacterium]|nr:diacylglycerol kinase family protein [Anaerolineae bacterium]
MKPASNRKFIVSFRCAVAGIRYAIKTQRNFRIHLSAAVLVLLAAYGLQISTAALGSLILTIFVILVVELFNTAVEVLVDLVCPDYHPLAKHVKDLAAGAVLVAAVGSVLVGIVILGPPLWRCLLQLLSS